MKSFKIIGAILRSACVTFTAVTLFAHVAIMLFLDSASDALLPSVVFGIFGFSVVLGCANYLYFKTKMNTLLRYFIHLVLTVGSAVAVLMIPGKNNGPAALFIGVCLTVLHLLFFLIYNIKNIDKSKKQDEYRPLYDKLKRD